jgi:hypothetical protein
MLMPPYDYAKTSLRSKQILDAQDVVDDLRARRYRSRMLEEG